MHAFEEYKILCNTRFDNYSHEFFCLQVYGVVGFTVYVEPNL